MVNSSKYILRTGFSLCRRLLLTMSLRFGMKLQTGYGFEQVYCWQGSLIQRSVTRYSSYQFPTHHISFQTYSSVTGQLFLV